MKKVLVIFALCLCLAFASTAMANGIQVTDARFSDDPYYYYQYPAYADQDMLFGQGFLHNLEIGNLAIDGEYLNLNWDGMKLDFAAVSLGIMSQTLHTYSYGYQSQGYEQCMSYETPNVNLQMWSEGYQYQYMDSWYYDLY
jgi:hypothetical protein